MTSDTFTVRDAFSHADLRGCSARAAQVFEDPGGGGQGNRLVFTGGPAWRHMS